MFKTVRMTKKNYISHPDMKSAMLLYYATGRLALNVEQDLSFWIEKKSSTIKAKVFHRKNFSEIKFCHSFEVPKYSFSIPELTTRLNSFGLVW